jgi:hypothetical protein
MAGKPKRDPAVLWYVQRGEEMAIPIPIEFRLENVSFTQSTKYVGVSMEFHILFAKSRMYLL